MEVESGRIHYIVEADIKGFFDNVQHDWMMAFLEHRIADKRVLRYVKRFLKAGVLEEGILKETEEGTPQGGLCKASHNPPCGVPSSVSFNIPSSSTPAFRKRFT